MKAKSVFSLLIFLLFVTSSVSVFAQTTPPPTELLPGDIAIIGFNSDGTDDFTFVVLKEIKAGTEIRFTDRGWRNTIPIGFVNFPGYDTVFNFIVNSDLTIGSVIHIISGSGIETFNLDPGADQLFVYSGNGSTVNKVIFGINTYNAGWLDSQTDPDTTISKSSSELPPDLIGSTAISLPRAENAYYKGLRSFSSVDEARKEIVKILNWEQSNGILSLPTTPFEFTTTDVQIQDFSGHNKNSGLIFIFAIFSIFLVLLANRFRAGKRN